MVVYLIKFVRGFFYIIFINFVKGILINMILVVVNWLLWFFFVYKNKYYDYGRYNFELS